MKILLLDNYDSFTYNLLYIVKEMGCRDAEVHRNDQINLDQINAFDKIILSPGPGIPEEAGILLPLIREYAPKKSILGVCLGHQALAEAFGATLINMENVCHGVSTPARIIGNDYIFNNIDQTLEVGRYHSWIISNTHFPSCLQITAIDEQGGIMAIKHEDFDIHGVQFHPESVLTPEGKKIVHNFLNKK